MADYITRDEFEAAIAALQCVGDQQTIDVTQSPGGQTIRSIQVIGDDADTAADTEYVSVSYDDIAEEYTVTVTDLPVSFIHGTQGNMSTGVQTSPNYEFPYNSTNDETAALSTMSKTLTFDKPTSAVAVNLYVSPLKRKSGNDHPSGNITWDISTGTLTASNAATEARRSDQGSRFYSATLPAVGTPTVLIKPTHTPVIAGYGLDLPYLIVDTDNHKIWLYNCVTPISLDATITGNGYTYTAPFNGLMILGWSNGDIRVTLDESNNAGAYDTWFYCGYIEIDANNNPLASEVITHRTTLPHLGYTGTANSSNTVTITNGIITNVT